MNLTEENAYIWLKKMGNKKAIPDLQSSVK